MSRPRRGPPVDYAASHNGPEIPPESPIKPGPRIRLNVGSQNHNHDNGAGPSSAAANMDGIGARRSSRIVSGSSNGSGERRISQGSSGGGDFKPDIGHGHGRGNNNTGGARAPPGAAASSSRRSTRNSTSAASHGEGHEEMFELDAGGGKSQAQAQMHRGGEEDGEGEVDEGEGMDVDGTAGGEVDAEGEEDDDPAFYSQPLPEEPYLSRGGRATRRKVVVESSSHSEDDFERNIRADQPQLGGRLRPRRGGGGGAGGKNTLNGFVEHDENEDDESDGPRRPRRSVRKAQTATPQRKGKSAAKRRAQESEYEEDDDADEDDEDGLGGEANSPDLPNLSDHTSDDNKLPDDRRVTRNRGKPPRPRRGRGEDTPDIEIDDGPRRLRDRRQPISYKELLPTDIFASASGKQGAGGRGAGGGGNGRGERGNHGFLADMQLGSGALGQPNVGMMPDSDSDDDLPGFVHDLRKEATAQTALHNGGSSGKRAANAPAAAGAASVAAGTVGRFNPEAARADADPLGVDLSVTFDQVGGLDNHINQLKEMVALPLLYPELFMQFGITPPRGVLFHGPPGTGKTLLARALAASCSSASTKIAFFMRKGADCLSKWVGEAERQLRLLFEEAKAAQPSIIFFDEIDGLAPVRSSKQDQVHSSLVATLLALMDGMDGRGQVIVIGATNRPDAVDPALRRPGRFDREFYFPLPNKEARRKIISINTRKWQPPLEADFLDELAGLTKGYGGADLRALCTEAALNAIQRKYPQVYKTNDRLLLDPSSITVQARDFMASVRKIVPSSARSASSSAQPIPPHLEPLLSESLHRVSQVVDELLPSKKRPTVLEEAEWEDENDDGTFARELLTQSFETLRVYRPRLLIYGQKGLGQRAIGSALLHRLEGYHVQNLDITELMGQSTATTEAMLVQMFIEAKRHQPSILYIPGLSTWASVLASSALATFGALLDSLTPAEPVIVIGVMEESPFTLDPVVQQWFGRNGENFVEIVPPVELQRANFFGSIFDKISLPPNQFPDGMPKRRRILEQLPLAPPLPPPVPSAAALAEQAAKDQTLKEILVFRLNPILADLKKKYKNCTVGAEAAMIWYDAKVAEDAEREKATAEAAEEPAAKAADMANEAEPIIVDGAEPDLAPPEAMHVDSAAAGPSSQGGLDIQHLPLPNVSTAANSTTGPSSAVNGTAAATSTVSAVTKPPRRKPHWVDFDHITAKLISNNSYLTPRAFLKDIERMAENIEICELDMEKRRKVHQLTKEASLTIKDHFQDEQYKLDLERMAAREYAKKKLEKGSPKSGHSSPSGTRASARLSGVVMENRYTNPLEIERNGKKRAREESSGPRGTPDGNAMKRSRLEDMGAEPMAAAAPAAAFDNLLHQGHANGHAVNQQMGPGGHAMAVPSNPDMVAGMIEQAAGPSQPRAHAFGPVPSHPHIPATAPYAAQHNNAAPQMMFPQHAGHGAQPGKYFPHGSPMPQQHLAGPSYSHSPVQQQHHLPPRSPNPPRPARQEFFLPAQTMQDFRFHLIKGTERFNIEDLEQVRALCLSIIWQHRAEWDRTSMLKHLRHEFDKFRSRVMGERL